MQKSKTKHAWLKASLLKLYATLTISAPGQAADLIFVMAGRMERKQYGLELFRAGWAPRLILSIGRFEVSKMPNIELDGLAELKTLRDQTPPDERHFFMKVDRLSVRVEKVGLRRWSTYGEALALRRFLQKDDARRVMIISSETHLRRVAFTFTKVFHHSPVHFSYCIAPFPGTFLKKESWWTHRDGCLFVVKELIKLTGYRMVLSMPEWAAHRVMRLKD